MSDYGSKVGTITRRSTYGADDEPSTLIELTRLGSNITSLDTEMGITRAEWELTLHHSTSFTEMFHQEVNRSQESLSSNYTTDHAAENEETLVETFSHLNGNAHSLTDHVRDYQSLLPQITYSDTASTARNTPRKVNFTPLSAVPAKTGLTLTEHFRRHDGLSPSTIYSEILYLHSPSNELVSMARSPSNLESSGVKIEKSSQTTADPPTPTPLRLRGLPPSMSIMNAMNEQDPAFIRTMEALHAREGPTRHPEVERSQSMMPARQSIADSGDRCFSSMSSRSVNGAKKRYASFLSKLRGHGST